MHRTRLFLLTALLLAEVSVGQDMRQIGDYTNGDLLALCEWRVAVGSDQHRPLGSQTGIGSVRVLPEFYEVIVDGEFNELPEATVEEIQHLTPQQTLVRFNVLDVLKGSAPESISIELNTDMLLLPEENMSRYAKRERIVEAQYAEWYLISDQLVALRADFDAGAIDRTAFEQERSRLLALRTGTSRVIPFTKSSADLHAAKTFYELEGAIRENEKYVMGIEPIPGTKNSFRLEEVTATYNIFWGQMREFALQALRAPEGLSEFGLYDPNSDEDCETLRRILGPPLEATPRNLAIELLDKHQLVAVGEFYAIPEFTRVELRGLQSKDARVRFRIQHLYKGEVVDSTKVKLNSDMLVVQGEDRSMHAKRHSFLEELDAYIRPHWDRVEEMAKSVDSGDVDLQALSAERMRVYVLVSERTHSLLSKRQVSSLVGDTFYDRGGVLHPNQSYLIGVNKVRGSKDVYSLGELPDSPSRIYWGQESDEVRGELKKLRP